MSSADTQGKCVLFRLGACYPQACACAKGERALHANEEAEAQLMAGVLRRGLADYIYYRGEDGNPTNDLGEDARAWLFDGKSSGDWVFSFLFLCGVFDLDPGGLRERVKSADPENIKRLRAADYGG